MPYKTKSFKPIVLMISAFTFAWSQPLTEAEAVLKALQNSPELAIQKLEFQKDKHSLQSVEGDGKLQADVRVPLSYQRTDSDLLGVSETRQGDVEAGLSQEIPGGGKVSVDLDESMDFTVSDSMEYDTDISVSLSQPLLKGFGKHADVPYRIWVQRNQYAISHERFVAQLATDLSRTREQYWDWISKSALAQIREKELEYASQELSYQRARFRIGEISEIDTLGAAIEWLRAQRATTTARQALKSSQRNLAIGLGVEEENVVPPVDLDIPMQSLSSAKQVMALVESTDTGLRILELTRKSLERQLGRSQNRKLPSLDLTASYGVGRSGDNAFGNNLDESGNATIGLVLSYDLFSRSQKHDAAKSKIDVQINEMQRRKDLRDLHAEFAGLFESWERDSLHYRLQSMEVSVAQRRYDAILQEEQLGTTDLLTRVKAKNDLIQAQIEKLQSAVALKRIEIAFDQSTKTIFQKFGVELP